MHESGMIKGLVHKIESVLEEQKRHKCTAVKVWLGALSQISASHFREHFENETIGTVAEGAELTIDVSEDISDPNAPHILLKSVDVNE